VGKCINSGAQQPLSWRQNRDFARGFVFMGRVIVSKAYDAPESAAPRVKFPQLPEGGVVTNAPRKTVYNIASSNFRAKT
jgi:hypothetical protein